MEKGKILFIDSTHPLLRKELEKDGFQCDFFPEKNREELKAIAGNYLGFIVRSKIRLDADFLAAATQLRFIGRVGAGMENIDQDFAESRGIVCLNAPEGNRDAVGEQALGMLLALLNNLLTADPQVRQGIWLREENRGTELGGKTVGIIGYGNTGSAFAKKLSGFDVRTLAYDKYKSGFSDAFAKEADMETIFRESDILSLHVPLTEETDCLVNSAFLNRFQKNIFLVNTSRGRVVKTADLVEALQNGKVRGACLDVLEYEGLSFERLDDSRLPEAFAKLVRLPNVILSPHIAGWTFESEVKLAETLLRKIRELPLRG